MPIRYYPALICQDGDSFGIVFPDLPGCVSLGDSIQHVAEMGAEALALHIEGMVEENMSLPAPSAPDVVPDWVKEDFGAIVTSVLVPVDLPGKTVRANITIDEGLLSRIDAAATADGNTRSGWLAQAARERLHQPR
jgi:predicted RNase H-like HicB family nuclease